MHYVLLKRPQMWIIVVLIVNSLRIATAGVTTQTKSWFDLAFIAPIELQDSPTSLTQVRQRLVAASSVSSSDATKFIDAIEFGESREIRKWIGSRNHRVITSQSEILKEIVAQNILHKRRPGVEPHIISDLQFYSAISNLLRNLNNFDDSPAGKLVSTMPLDAIASCTIVLRGQDISQSDLVNIKGVRSELLNGPLMQNATAINLCNLVILDQSNNLPEFLDNNSTLPLAMRLRVATSSDSNASSHIVRELIESGYKDGSIDLNQTIFTLYAWGNKDFVPGIAHKLLNDLQGVEFAIQTAQLYWLLRQLDDSQISRLQAIERLQFEALFAANVH